MRASATVLAVVIAYLAARTGRSEANRGTA